MFTTSDGSQAEVTIEQETAMITITNSTGTIKTTWQGLLDIVSTGRSQWPVTERRGGARRVAGEIVGRRGDDAAPPPEAQPGH